MKVNLKKIGAFVAGATILASSVAFAGLMFGSTKLVDGNGAPVAKVVVGEKGMASDGVAAANIAAKLASEAYKTQNLTAQLSGSATCKAGNSTSSASSCTVTNEKVTLEITVPGSVVSGTYTLNNLVGDYLNRELLDRNMGSALTTYSYGGDTAETANPFTDGTSSGNIGVSRTEMYRISGTMFSPFQTATVTDNSAGRSYSEQQDMWVYGSNVFDESALNIVGDLRFIAYTLKFKGASDDLGIPVCTTPTNSSLYATCDTDYQTETHKLKIKFLGEDWVISDMVAPTTSITTETTLVNGGSIKLAKESVSGILNQGEALSVDNLKFQLDDLEAHGDTTSAIISVLDANGNTLKKDKVTPATTKEFSVSGKTYRFHVYKVAPGYTFGAKWADVAIFSTELKLQDAYKLDPDYDDNQYWYVALGWKNKGATSAETAPDHLRTVVLWSQDISSLSSGGSFKLKEGDYVPLVQSPVTWKYSYKGLSIDSSNRDSFTVTMERSSDLTVSTSQGPLQDSSGSNCTLIAPYIRVHSSKSGSTFGITSAVSGVSAGSNTTSDAAHNEFYLALSGGGCGENMTFPSGSAFMKISANSRYSFKWYASPEINITYSTIGDGETTWGGGGLVSLTNWTDVNITQSQIGASLQMNTSTSTSVQPEWVLAVSEKAGTGVSNAANDIMMWPIDISGTSSSFNVDVVQGSTYFFKKDYVTYIYAGPAGGSAGNRTTGKEGFITERGSLFSAIEDTSITAYFANKLGKAQWYLASSSANTSSSSTAVKTLKEGESTTVSGVTVKAKSIDQTATCAGGSSGTPACTADMTGVSAVIMPKNAKMVQASIPYAYSNFGPLVMLDKDATSVSTVVSVGGPMVNTVTKSIMSGGTHDWSASPKLVKEYVAGSKIVVAGKSASDTTAAAADFIKQVKRV